MADAKRWRLTSRRSSEGREGSQPPRFKLSFSRLVLASRGAAKAKATFKSLIKPQRPPMPGTATPAGYVINRRPTPSDAAPVERARDKLLDWGTKPVVAYIQVVWTLVLIATFVVFLGCLMYWFHWGFLTDPLYPCTGEGAGRRRSGEE